MFINLFKNNFNKQNRYFDNSINDFEINYKFESSKKRKLNSTIDLCFEILNF